MIRSKACQSGGLFYLGGESLTGLALKIKLSKEGGNLNSFPYKAGILYY
ncbi:hypothetical protein [Acinetobacter sp. 10FS3-1]|nr:hypothetical protein [Acinetobacter sp. 10FS3-1]